MQIHIPNSEIRIPAYKQKYVVGDIVYLPNRNNKAGIYLKIKNSVVHFSAFSVINGGSQIPNIADSYYSGQIMLGSKHDVQSIPRGEALVGYLVMDVLDVDTRAEFVANKKEDYLLFDRRTPMEAIDEIERNLKEQAIETNGLT